MNRTVRTIQKLILIFSVIFLSACQESGTWTDDAQNWERIFQHEKPSDVTLLHSSYWRSPHFAYEYEYFLQIQKNSAFEKQILSAYPMAEIVDKKELAELAQGSQGRPDWFIPKPISKYRVWKYSDLVDSRFRLLIDKESGDVFLTDIQL